jgi:hypothetical protein
VPTPATLVGGHLFHNLAANFEGGDFWETDGYIGVPLLLAFGALVRASWRTRRTTRFLLATFTLSVILALGSHLHIAGRSGLPLPGDVLARLPLFDGLVPSRFAVFAELTVAVAIAVWVAEAPPRRLPRWLVALLGAVLLLPNVAGAWFNTRPVNPSFFRTSEYRRYLRPGENVLVLPFAQDGERLLWQSETGFYFTMPGGHISAAEPAWAQHSAAVNDIFNATAQSPISASATSTIRAFMRRQQIRHIVVEPSDARTYAPVLRRLAPTPLRVGGVLLYTVG